jgi:hypothetical protein
MPTQKKSRPRNQKGKGKGKGPKSSKAPHTILPQWLHWALGLVFATLAVQSFHDKIYAQGGVLTALAVISLVTSFFSFSLVPWLASWEKTSAKVLRDSREVRVYAPLFLFLFSIVLFWQPLSNPGLTFAGVDNQFYYPYKVYWTESLKAGDPAFWNPFYHLGIPFYAWPGVGACSPFNILHFFLPHTLAVTVDFFCHLFLAALGMYFLMGLWGAIWQGRLISAMAFAMGGYSFIRLHQGQFLVFEPVAYLPWILYCAQKALNDRRILWVALGGGLAALSFLEGFPQLSQYTLMTVGIYLLGAWIFKNASFKTVAWTGLGIVAGYVLLSAFALLPQMEYVQTTNRWHFNYNDLMVDHYCPIDLSIFLDPMRGSYMDGHNSAEGISAYTEVGNYLGLVPLFLVFSCVWIWRKTPRLAWFSFAIVLLTLLAMGNDNPVSKTVFDFFYYHVPLFNHHRCLGRMMIIPCFFGAVLAGLALTEWVRRFPILKQDPWRWALVALVALTALDLWNFDKKMVSLAPPDEFTGADKLFPKGIASQILADPTYPRIQPEYDIAADITNKIAEVRCWEDTAPEWSGRFIQIINENYDAQTSDVIGLKYMYHEPWFKNPPPRWKPLTDNTILNTKALPRAYVTGGWRLRPPEGEIGQIIRENGVDSSQETYLENKPDGIPDSHPEFLGGANITLYKNNEVQLEGTTAKPGLLFFSDTYFPGWKAWLNGTPVPIIQANEAFRAVVLPQAGPYKVRMVYDPTPLKIGAVVSLVAWLVWGWVVWRRRKTLLPA